MKFNKKIKFILIGSILTAAIPFTAVSCLYENDKTVLYAKSFVKENGFLVKTKVADQKNTVLKEFEDKLYKSNFLTYNFSSLILSFKVNNFTIDNKHYAQKLQNIISLKDDKLSKNQENYDNFKNIIKITSNGFKNYVKANQSANKRAIDDIKKIINFNEIVLKDFEKKYQELENEIKKYNEIVGSKDKKTLLEISKAEFSDTNTNSAIEVEKVIKNLINSLSNIEIYNIKVNDFQYVITYDKVRKVLENFVKNTPFAMYYNYATYIKNNSNPNANFNPANDFLEYDSSNLSYKVNFFTRIINNGIPTPTFQEINQKVENEFKTKFEKDDAIKTLDVIWKSFIKLAPGYSVDKDLIEDTEKGAGSGFGPIYLAFGQNPQGKAEDEYKIFINPLEGDEVNDFLVDPSAYIDKHIDKIILKRSSFDKKIEILQLEKGIADLRKRISESSNPNEKIRLRGELRVKLVDIGALKEELKEVEKYRAELTKLVKKLENDPNNSEIKEKIDKLNEPYEDDIKYVKDKVKEESQTSQTSHFGLADLFSKLLFFNGVYKTQVVKGYKLNKNVTQTDPNAKVATYWVEFFDKKTEKWYMLDIYNLLIDQQKNLKNSLDISKYLHTNLNGIEVDVIYQKATNLK
ncbi:hypothetical protein RRG52_00120 [Mycoplasmopsis cynos]|uniref:hypothetical protein n=1 Tax=Mycoplasmopsis cynos TaxID=171284 RepID=UPI002AFFF6BA|nr:hypothetical protein [Mycoplasmopsis cynos]WQQ13946.1 hypothetical protein RRG52_00120 [Mycoplasmopsis cynos]